MSQPAHAGGDPGQHSPGAGSHCSLGASPALESVEFNQVVGSCAGCPRGPKVGSGPFCLLVEV